MILRTVNRMLKLCVAHIERRLAKETPEPVVEPEEQTRRAIALGRKVRRSGRTPWYYARPRERTIPDNLRYFEDVHGTPATLEALARKAKKLDK
jgi:hypothetical protein